jgi:hypothetical protein
MGHLNQVKRSWPIGQEHKNPKTSEAKQDDTTNSITIQAEKNRREKITTSTGRKLGV